MKILIADDEKKICTLIRKLIPWDELGLICIGEAYSGRAALDIIKKQSPDLVITDIKMPGIDGLELVKRTRELDQNIHFIIISGHKHFEYAYNALKYGVDNYLLKPICKQELNNTLLKLCHDLRKNNNQKEHIVEIKNQLAKNAAMLRKQFLLDIINRDVELSVDLINEKYQYNFKAGIFQVLIVKLDGLGKSEAILDKIYLTALEEFAENCTDIESVITENRMIIIINYPYEKAKAVERSIKYAFDSMDILMELYDFYEYTMGVGLPIRDINELNESLTTAIRAIKSRFLLGTRRLISASDINYGYFDSHRLLTIEWKQKFEHSIEILDINILADLIKRIFNNSTNTFREYPSCVFDLAANIFDLFAQTLIRFDMRIDNIEDLSNKMLEDLDNSISVINMRNRLIENISEIISVFVSEKKSQDNLPIIMAKQYINEHYNEPITLEQIANHIYLNPIYFSMKFKKETGVNFSEYLTEIRIEQAKKLIKEVKYNISETAVAVGYKDPKYFSKLFTRTVGLKPGEYRKLCQINKEVSG